MKELQEITEGALAPVVFDATGSTKSMCHAFNYVAHTGRLVFVGIVTDEIHFSDPLLHRREMTVFASRNALPDDFRHIIGSDRGGTHRYPAVDHASHAVRGVDRSFSVVHQPETGVIKAMVEVD